MPRPLKITRDVSDDELQQTFRNEKNPKVKERIMLLIRLRELGSLRKAAASMGYVHGTVSIWVKRFNQDGFKGLEDRLRSGRPTKITKDMFDRILSSSPKDHGYPVEAWTVKLLHVHLKKQEGVDCSRNTVYRRLYECGYEFIMPRPKSYHVDPKEREAFKKSHPIDRNPRQRSLRRG